MRDYGIDKALVRKFDTSKHPGKDYYYGFRKMFWKYLKKLGVPFYDPCCPTASGSDVQPIGYYESLGGFVRFDGTDWVPITSFTTTTSSTTTTTVAPTTTTTTTTP